MLLHYGLSHRESENDEGKKWSELAAALPEEYREDVLRELRLLDSLRKPEAAKWLASLYDPETGAWYISESGRDYEGFGPDIESTFYALSLVGYTGMAEMFDGKDYMEKFTYAYPKDILDKVGKWMYELQDEDGFFYVPQWSKKWIEENGKQIRITRDVGTAKRVLRALGITPKYSDAKKSEGGEKKEAKSALLSQYESVENFREYLEGFEKELSTCTEAERAWKFYLWGSYFQSTLGMMNDEMKRMMVEFFNKHQRADNGVWTKELSYNSTNAIHKICSCYNSIGAPMNYVDQMIDSTLEILRWKVEDKPTDSACAIYNVWSVFPYLYENIRSCGEGTPEEREAKCKEKKALVFRGAAEAINTTYHQIKELCLEDGSFSVSRGRSYSSVYGCPCALGIKEGDIGGFLLGAWDVEHYVMLALEIDDYEPPMFTEKDRLIYMRGLRAAKPIVKKPIPQKQGETTMNVNNIVHKEGELAFVLGKIKEFSEKIGLPLFADAETRTRGEIVIGDTSREITKKARALLDEKREDGKSGYLIYSDGESAALVYTDFQVIEAALAALSADYERICSGEYARAEFFPLKDYLEKRDAKIRTEVWARLEAMIPEEYREEVMRELRRLYSLYDSDKIVKWIAGLHDPVTGGWYISESGRDHEGFLPSIEETYYGLTIMGHMGMAEMFEGQWNKAMPRDILEKIGNWIYSLQDPDGYFYLPQWPKEFIEKVKCQIRITRDVGSAKSILKGIGITPKYTEIVSAKAADDSSKSPLLAQYESVESFREYLAGLEKEAEPLTGTERARKFYLYASYFQSTTQLMTEEMRRMACDFFDKHQNPENGMWSENLSYASTNAIHKICSIYNTFGRELRYADKIVDSTIKILNDMPNNLPHTTCEIYNVWSDFPYIYKNIRKCSPGTPEEKEERCRELKMRVFASVSGAIRATYDQLLDFRIDNGSFSTFRGRAASGWGGCPYGVPNTKEGDFGGLLFATNAMSHHILAALELESAEPPYFTEKHRQMYIEAIRSAKPIVKKPNPNPQS